MVRQVDKGRLAKEVYILHENIIGDREILILTSKRLAYIQSNAVMGGWSCDWEYLYTDIQIPSIQLEGSRFFMIISPQVCCPPKGELRTWLVIRITTSFSQYNHIFVSVCPQVQQPITVLL